MNETLFTGALVRLSDENPQDYADAFSRWNRNPEYVRLLDSAAPHMWSAKKIKDWFEKDEGGSSPTNLIFSIRTLAEDRLIGFIAFDEIRWAARDAWVAIGIGEMDVWNKGYGSDAMRLMLCYGFTELNLNRISLGVFSTNPRGIRSYEKCGFVHEGLMREFMKRDGQYWDLVFMGILREEWEVMMQKEKEGKNE